MDGWVNHYIFFFFLGDTYIVPYNVYTYFKYGTHLIAAAHLFNRDVHKGHLLSIWVATFTHLEGNFFRNEMLLILSRFYFKWQVLIIIIIFPELRSVSLEMNIIYIEGLKFRCLVHFSHSNGQQLFTFEWRL